MLLPLTVKTERYFTISFCTHRFNFLAVVSLLIAGFLRLSKRISSFLHRGKSEGVWLHWCHRLVERIVHLRGRHATNVARWCSTSRNHSGLEQLLLNQCRWLPTMLSVVRAHILPLDYIRWRLLHKVKKGGWANGKSRYKSAQDLPPCAAIPRQTQLLLLPVVVLRPAASEAKPRV